MAMTKKLPLSTACLDVFGLQLAWPLVEQHVDVMLCDALRRDQGRRQQRRTACCAPPGAFAACLRAACCLVLQLLFGGPVAAVCRASHRQMHKLM